MHTKNNKKEGGFIMAIIIIIIAIVVLKFVYQVDILDMFNYIKEVIAFLWDKIKLLFK